MDALKTIVELSHEFGTREYVKGGGGNTSVKNETTLWVKPSGTTLTGLTEETFVALNRAKVNELYGMETPVEPAEREELVKNLMAEAVENEAGRPSVEAPLHNILDTRFVVHTHPVLVNGLTSAKDGEATCNRLFPDALWVEYIDPGYTLCMELNGRIEQYKAAHGKGPELIFLKNHGVFVAADSADAMRVLYARVMDALKAEYGKAGVSDVLEMAYAAPATQTENQIKELFGDDAAHIVSSGMFAYAPGPITPDHLVYARAFPFTDELTEEAAATYKAERGYAPKVVVAAERVFGIGATRKNAELALDFAQDGAQVLQLAAAFGGIDYMTDGAREFIEKWEVESYRQTVAS
ncbi:MAG: class II aldolase [Syntrophobacterales bacterium]|nr:MAG: class II aldolase [Syntrophobacterales bacterium]